MHEQRVGRAVEDAVEEVADHAADDLLARLRRAKDMRAVLGGLGQISLLLQDAHHRHDGGVGNRPCLAQRFVDVADRRRVARPDDLHDRQLLRRERGMRRPHRLRII